ncbi:type IV pilus assembly protein PilV [Colwellia chukchiensis]|uniref:Type IV pilus assembly protein PilV n=1 Tax=Colwellia chukchiensis TaxID=641665 RepID=A0A1H7FY97_9GAMM|nr:type IV pilus modification protein PilV [Colwellia chukchiensis]SEK30227.1 type IV pilus assembly protein PilV [Colwellia chukchiensis]
MNNSLSTPKYRKFASNRGMTFIEVLVAVFILVTGILGAVAMQASAKKGSFDAMQRSVASALAQDIIERMRSNDVANLASYNGTDYGVKLDPVPANRCNTLGNLCTAAEIVTNDLYEWEMSLMGADVVNSGNNVAGLTGVVGCISVATNAVTVVVSWQGRTEIADAKKDSCGTANTKRRQLMVKAFIN